MKLYLDPGHGGSDPGAQGNDLNEKDVTLDIALRLRNILLNDYENVEVRMSRTSDITKSLYERTNEANSWGADFYLSIHINSDNNSAQGYEDYIYYGLSDTSTTAKYQNIIHAEVIKVNQLKDRGEKKEDFHVLRESSMPAMLTENGFIDHVHDAALMKQASWREAVAQGHANGLAKAFNLKTKSPGQPGNPLPGTLFKVIAGYFQSKENAEERVAYLRSKGFQAFINTITISGEIWYRTQTGAYANRENAEQQLNELKKAGINDAFLVAETVSTAENKAPDKNNVGKQSDSNSLGTSQGTGSSNTSGMGNPSSSGQTGNSIPGNGAGTNQPGNQTTGSGTNATGGASSSPNGTNNTTSNETANINTILGPTYLSPELMDLFAKSINPGAPELGSYYQTFGKLYGIRGDIAFAQSLLETNFFRFTGVVQPNQNNFGGLGSTGPNTRGASFKTPEDGVLAQLQHLFAYTTTKPLPGTYPLVDPRFHLVHRGSASSWTDLNGKWAYPGENYGQSILNLYQRMIDFTLQLLENIRKGNS